MRSPGPNDQTLPEIPVKGRDYAPFAEDLEANGVEVRALSLRHLLSGLRVLGGSATYIFLSTVWVGSQCMFIDLLYLIWPFD